MKLTEIIKGVLSIILKDVIKRTLESMIKEEEIAAIVKEKGTLYLESLLWQGLSELAYEEARKLRVEYGQRKKKF